MMYNSLRLFIPYIGQQVRPVFQRSGLPSPQLAQIWNQVDQDSDGLINLQQFVMAMNMIRQAQAAGSSPLPITVRPHPLNDVHYCNVIHRLKATPPIGRWGGMVHLTSLVLSLTDRQWWAELELAELVPEWVEPVWAELEEACHWVRWVRLVGRSVQSRRGNITWCLTLTIRLGVALYLLTTLKEY